MIEGCLDWQKHGLIRPKVVTDATESYFAEQDLINQRIEDECNTGSAQFDTVAILFKSWTNFCLSNGQRTTTSVLFSQNLAMLGFEPVKHTPGQNGKRGFKGIAVKPVTTTHRTEPQRYEDGGL